jgi:hypothetical protein
MKLVTRENDVCYRFAEESRDNEHPGGVTKGIRSGGAVVSLDQTQHHAVNFNDPGRIVAINSRFDCCRSTRIALLESPCRIKFSSEFLVTVFGACSFRETPEVRSVEDRIQQRPFLHRASA